MFTRIILRNSLRNHRIQNVTQKRNISFTNWVDACDKSAPVEFAMRHLMDFHEVFHIPWWSEIVIVTLGLRAIVTFPLIINQRKIFQRFNDLQPEIQELSESLKKRIMLDVRAMGGDSLQFKRVYRKTVRFVV